MAFEKTRFYFAVVQKKLVRRRYLLFYMKLGWGNSSRFAGPGASQACLRITIYSVCRVRLEEVLC
jgi:hypothetical protein